MSFLKEISLSLSLSPKAGEGSKYRTLLPKTLAQMVTGIILPKLLKCFSFKWKQPINNCFCSDFQISILDCSAAYFHSYKKQHNLKFLRDPSIPLNFRETSSFHHRHFCCCCSVPKSCPTLHDPTDYRTTSPLSSTCGEIIFLNQYISPGFFFFRITILLMKSGVILSKQIIS